MSKKKILGLKSKVAIAGSKATVTGITAKRLTLLKDKGGYIQITLAEADELLQTNKMEVEEI